VTNLLVECTKQQQYVARDCEKPVKFSEEHHLNAAATTLERFFS
jgi:hypothetical protein